MADFDTTNLRRGVKLHDPKQSSLDMRFAADHIDALQRELAAARTVLSNQIGERSVTYIEQLERDVWKQRMEVGAIADFLLATGQHGIGDKLLDAVRCCGEFPECGHVAAYFARTAKCDGSGTCAAQDHIHGCFSDPAGVRVKAAERTDETLDVLCKAILDVYPPYPEGREITTEQMVDHFLGASQADYVRLLAVFAAMERAAKWIEDRQDPPRYAAEILRAALAENVES